MEALLDRLERLGDPLVREDARALVGLLLRWHRDALARLLDLAGQTGGGSALLDAWKRDPQAAALLLLHGLHPDDLSSRVRQALDGVQTVAAFLGVEVRVLHVGEESVRLALSPAPGVPVSAIAEVRAQIESALTARAPEIQAVHFQVSGLRRVSLPLAASEQQ
jgi:hypothetical protein